MKKTFYCVLRLGVKSAIKLCSSIGLLDFSTLGLLAVAKIVLCWISSHANAMLTNSSHSVISLINRTFYVPAFHRSSVAFDFTCKLRSLSYLITGPIGVIFTE